MRSYSKLAGKTSRLRVCCTFDVSTLSSGGSKQKRTGVLASEELLTLVYAKVCEAQGTRAGQMKALEGEA